MLIEKGLENLQSAPSIAESHQKKLKAYNKAYRYLKKQHIDLNVNLDALEAEYSKLQTDHAAFARQLEQMKAEFKPLNKIRCWLSQVLRPEQGMNQQMV